MRYVDRDPNTGEVIAHFACDQRPGAKPPMEQLEDEHPDLLAFVARREAIVTKTRERIRILNELVDAKIAESKAAP